MRARFKLTLRRRLLGGFLLCALVTIACAVVGVVALHRIQRSLELTATNISAIIDKQNKQSSSVTALREITAQVGRANNADALEPLKERIGSKLEVTDEDSPLAQAWVEAKALHDYKTEKLQAETRVAALTASWETVIEQATKQAKELADTAAFNAAMATEDANGQATATTVGAAVQTLQSAYQVSTYCAELKAQARGVCLTDDDEKVDAAKRAILTNLGSAETSLLEIKANEAVPKLQGKLDDLKGLAEAMAEARKMTLQADRDFEDSSKRIAGHLAALERKLVLQAAKTKGDTERASQRSSAVVTGSETLQIGFGVFACIFALGVGLYVSKSITNPMQLIMRNLEEIAAGDFTKRLQIRKADEIGELAAYVDTVVDKLQESLRNVADSTRTLSASSEGLSMVSAELATGAQTTSAQANSVAATGEQLSANINTIATGAEEMSTSVSTVATAVEEMSTSLSEVAKNCEQESRIASDADAQAKNTRELMEKLGESAGEIGKVVEVINSIAEQTNLLALNATIEAASAGEAGKGFAVVANEVKELAKQSGQATEQISQQIKNMQSNTQNAVRAIEEIAKVIEQVSGISSSIAAAVEQQSSTTSEIARNIGGASQAANEIARNVQDAAKAAHEVSANIQEVDKVSHQTAAGAAETKGSAQELAGLASRLQQIVEQFKV